MKKLSLGIAAVSALAAMAVTAQNAAPPRTDTAPGAAATSPGRSSSTAASVQFSAVDQNKDGRISRAEAVAHGSELGGAFATLDADSDTYLSQAEFGKWSQKKGADHDGHREGSAAGRDLPQPTTGAGNSSTRTPATGE